MHIAPRCLGVRVRGGPAAARRVFITGSRHPVIKVKPRGNESVQQLLRRFKRLCQREGLTRDIKRTSYYEKPSEKKRSQSRKSVRRVAEAKLS